MYAWWVGALDTKMNDTIPDSKGLSDLVYTLSHSHMLSLHLIAKGSLKQISGPLATYHVSGKALWQSCPC